MLRTTSSPSTLLLLRAAFSTVSAPHLPLLPPRLPPPSPATLALITGLLGGDRSSLARAITLVESTHPGDCAQAVGLLEAVADAPRPTPSVARAPLRVGFAGPPGAGKSSLIEALGVHALTDGRCGDRLAVVAVDPSSHVSGGSLLGDKTRLVKLARDPRAYVRPSPTRGTLGGLAAHTSDVITLCEAGGYPLVFVETVGLGQSEVAVDDAVDVLVLVLAPGAGDELQAAKRGIMEAADVVAVNKCDGEGAGPAAHAAGDLARALHLSRPKRSSPPWTPPVFCVSARTGEGVPQLWEALLQFRDSRGQRVLSAAREAQAVSRLRASFEATVTDAARSSPAVAAAVDNLVGGRRGAPLSARRAVGLLVEAWRKELCVG